MRILIVNDDGVNGPGLTVAEEIAAELIGDDGEVWVVAPETERSGASHCISYVEPMRVQELGPRRFAIAGYPADFICIVEEEPSREEIKVGDAYAVAQEDVSDWIIVDANGVIHGGFSLRALLPTLDVDERTDLISQLAPLPRR